MASERVLVVDDERTIRRALVTLLDKLGYQVTEAPNLTEGRRIFDSEGADLVMLDVNLPDGNGQDFLKELRDRSEPPLVMMMTGQATVEIAVHCMREGAFDFVVKPFTNNHIQVALERASKISHLVTVNRYLTSDLGSDKLLIGQSPVMKELQRLIRQVAPVSATVLIQGESGTGKELVAREIHRQSLRGGKPFVRVNCAAMNPTLVESEFFGHEKGAFTGATVRRKGRFEVADGGTILLDEISEISPELQAKLLRVLQEGEFERVGGNATHGVDVRVLATTNRDLQQTVAEGDFREDLYYRLNVFPIQVPALRERAGDCTELARHFLQNLAPQRGRRVSAFSEAALASLESHRWPGNVRELRNAVERAIIMVDHEEEIQPSDLGLEAAPTPAGPPPAEKAVAEAPPSLEGFRLSFAGDLPTWNEVEREYILRVLEQEHGNRTHASERMGISLRTLRNKLNQYRLEGEAVISPAGAGRGRPATADRP